MPGIRVLAEALPPAKSAAETPLRDYLTRLREELEFLLTHLEADNLGPELTETLAGKQDALSFDDAPVSGSGNPVTSRGIWQAVRGQASLLAEAADVTADGTAVTLGDEVGNYSWLILFGTAGGTNAQSRFTLTVPTVVLTSGSYFPLAARATLGYVRLSASGRTLNFLTQSFTSMTVRNIYGKL